MKSEFAPKALASVRVEVRKKHPKMDEVAEYQTDSAFLDQIKKWSQMSKEEIESEAVLIPMRQIRKLARYVPGNSLHVPMRNLIRIVFLRATKDIAGMLFGQWQDFYQNKDLCFLLYQLCKDKKNITEDIFLQCQLTDEQLMRWLKSSDIPYTVGRDCATIFGERKPFQERLSDRHISPNGKLGRSCSERFLTFCTREDYLDYSDQEMRSLIGKYSEQTMLLFLLNILEKLEVQDFRLYYFCGSYLRDHFTGNVDSDSCRRIFKKFPAGHELKYRRWQNYILVKDSFAANDGDERLQFWSQYVPYSMNAYRNAESESLVMEFECYTIVEFTTATMGPLYIYRKDVFERNIKKYLKQMDNQELRHLLYNELKRYYEMRIVHNDNWQWKTSRYLTAHSIIS